MDIPAEQYIPSPSLITFPQKQFLFSTGLIEPDAFEADADADAEAELV
jgi:hypothetical protein